MIVDVQGAAGVVAQSIPISALTTNSTVKLKYFHFPALPLLDAFDDAVTVNANSEKFDVPASSSIEDIVNALDGFVDSGGNRVCFVWYNSHELEICVGTQAITLSAAFAAAMKLGTALAASTCYSSSLYESSVSLYSHYAVQIAHARGHWSNNAYDSVVGKVRRDGDVSAAHTHYFRGPVHVLELSVNAVKRDGTVVPYVSPEVWGLGLQIA